MWLSSPREWRQAWILLPLPRWTAKEFWAVWTETDAILMALVRLAQTMLWVDRSMPHQGNRDSLVKGALLNWRQIYFVWFKMDRNYTGKNIKPQWTHQENKKSLYDAASVHPPRVQLFMWTTMFGCVTTSHISVMLLLSPCMVYPQSADYHNEKTEQANMGLSVVAWAQEQFLH